MANATLTDPLLRYYSFMRTRLDIPSEPGLPQLPGPRDPLRSLDSVEIATMTVTTPGAAWEPRGRGATFFLAARLASLDADGKLHGLSGFQIARSIWPVPNHGRLPWRGLVLLAAFDADPRTQIQVRVDGAPRGEDDWRWRREGERLHERLAAMSLGHGGAPG